MSDDFDAPATYVAGANDNDRASATYRAYPRKHTVDRLDLQPGVRMLAESRHADIIGPLGARERSRRAAADSARGRIGNVEFSIDLDELPLPSPEVWWDIVLGTGMRKWVMQLDQQTAGRVREQNPAPGLRACRGGAVSEQYVCGRHKASLAVALLPGTTACRDGAVRLSGCASGVR